MLSSKAKKLSRRQRKNKNGGRNAGVGSRPDKGGVQPYMSGVVNRDLNLFPMKYRAKLRYVEFVDLGVQSSASRSYIFAANGMYDPNITGTGHQPMGFDQMMVSYNHYCVLKSTIRVQFSSEISTPGYELLGGIGVTRASSPSTTLSLVLEEGNLVAGICGSVSAGGGAPTPPYVESVDIGKFQSVTYPLDDDTLKGTASANPATLVYFAVYSSCPYAAGTSTDHAYAYVTIEYDAVFTEPIPLAQSFSALKKKAYDEVVAGFETGDAVVVHAPKAASSAQSECKTCACKNP